MVGGGSQPWPAELHRTFIDSAQMHPMAVLFSSVYFGKPALTSQTTVHLSPAPFVLLAGHSYFNVAIMTGSDRKLSLNGVSSSGHSFFKEMLKCNNK